MPSTANPPKFLSFNWMRGVVADNGITIIHRLVLIRLCLHRRNDSGRCEPGYDKVADELGVDRATIFRAVDVGIQFGWLAGFSRHGGRVKRNFVFTLPDDTGGNSRTRATVKARNSRTPATVNSRTRATQQSQPCDGLLYGRLYREKDSGEESDSPRPDLFVGKKEEAAEEERKTSANPAPSASGQKEDRGDRRSATDDGADAFAQFWSSYPRKKAKVAARKAFAKAVEDGTAVETLIAGAQRYAVERKGENPKYTAHAATWLNGRRWEDEAPGAPVIDEAGNVVAFEREQEAQPSSKSALDIVNECSKKIRACDGDGHDRGRRPFVRPRCGASADEEAVGWADAD